MASRSSVVMTGSVVDWYNPRDVAEYCGDLNFELIKRLRPIAAKREHEERIACLESRNDALRRLGLLRNRHVWELEDLSRVSKREWQRQFAQNHPEWRSLSRHATALFHI